MPHAGQNFESGSIGAAHAGHKMSSSARADLMAETVVVTAGEVSKAVYCATSLR